MSEFFNLKDYFDSSCVLMSNLSSDGWFIGDEAEYNLKAKIESNGVALKNWGGISINFGVNTGCNSVFIIDFKTKNDILDACLSEDERIRTESIIKPILRGKDLLRYEYSFNDNWLLFLSWHFPNHLDNSINGVSVKAERDFKDLYYSVYNYLLQYKSALLKRSDVGVRFEWYVLSRFAGSHYLDFETDKIAWGNISYNSAFTFVDKGVYVCGPALMLTCSHNLKFLLGYMNSKLFNYLFKKVGIFLGNAFEWKKSYIEQVSIPSITDINIATVSQIESLVDDIVEGKKSLNKMKISNSYSDADIQSKLSAICSLESRIDELVYSLYDLNEDEIKLVENSLK